MANIFTWTNKENKYRYCNNPKPKKKRIVDEKNEIGENFAVMLFSSSHVSFFSSSTFFFLLLAFSHFSLSWWNCRRSLEAKFVSLIRTCVWFTCVVRLTRVNLLATSFFSLLLCARVFRMWNLRHQFSFWFDSVRLRESVRMIYALGELDENRQKTHTPNNECVNE